MQVLIRPLLGLLLSHLLTDFVFQTNKLVKSKQAGRILSYGQHGVIHYLCGISIISFLIPDSFFLPRVHYALLALTGIHLLIDWCKSSLIHKSDKTSVFVADQMLHIVTVFVAAVFIAKTSVSELQVELSHFRELDNKIIFLLVVYVAVIFGGGYLIRFLTKTLSAGSTAEESSAQLRNAGLYIGWLERFLVLTALLLQSPATVGLILAAKSIARYPEMKEVKFAEYFLIGTLLSISIAIVGASALLKVF